MAEKYLCPHCLGAFTITKANKFRQHGGCMGSGETVPAHQLAKGPIGAGVDLSVPEEGRDIGTCNTCGLKVKLTPDGLYGEHQRPVMGVRCPESGYPYQPKETPCPTVPTVAPVTVTIASPPTSGQTHSFLQPGASSTGAVTTAVTAPAAAAPTPAAASPFSQPTRRSSDADPVQPMTTLGEQITAGLKQMFFHYQQRKTTDNRSAQAHLGPSEHGTPCDRRLAMSLLGIPAVNPGGDGWAAFRGTAVHVALAEMFQWADGGSGRYAVEVPLTFPSVYVPRGTGDLLDRTLFMFDDHKLKGQWALKKLRAKGATATERVQVHTYAYGARLLGEKIDHVAIIGWPSDQSSLDELYVWTEPYDASVALAALKRVADLAARVEERRHGLDHGHVTPLEVGRSFPIDPSACLYCPFHAPGDTTGQRGCNGRD